MNIDLNFLSALASSPSQAINKVPTDNARRLLLDSHGELRVLPRADVLSLSRDELLNFMLERGIYVMPTVELADMILKMIEATKASSPMEIGAGNGALARHMGIRAVDNHMQHPTWRPDTAAGRRLWESNQSLFTNQGRVQYGSDVLKIDGEAAVKRFKPDFILGQYLTHRFDAKLPERGGNSFGPSFDKMIKPKSTKTFVLIGNEKTHENHTMILDAPHANCACDGLICRATYPEHNRMFVWRRDADFDFLNNLKKGVE